MTQKFENHQINSDKTDDLSDEGQVKIKKGLTRFFITVEPIKLCIGFTWAFTTGVTIDLIQRNICSVQYNLSHSECLHLNVTSDIKTEVEAKTAQVDMINNVIQGIFALFISLFIGPWSDTNGRKPFILWSVRGFVLYYLLWAVISFFPKIPIAILYLPSIPLGCTGGLVALFVCATSYTCDNFETEERPIRFSINTSAMTCGFLIGNSLAEPLFNIGGYYGFQLVFFISFLVSLSALLYTTYGLEETIVRKTKKGKLLDFKHILSIFETVLLKPKKGHLMIIFTLSVAFSEIPVFIGEKAIAYMVGKSQYNWTLGEFNLYAAMLALISAILPLVEIWFLIDICGFQSQFVLIIGSIIFSVFQALKAVSVNETMYWVMSILCRLCGVIGPCLDSEFVELVSEENVGKVITFNSLIDAFAPLIGVPVYTKIYTALLPDKTLYVHFFSFAMGLVALIGSSGIYIKKHLTSTSHPVNSELTKESGLSPESETLQLQNT